MLPRILTGLVGIPVFLGLLYLGSWPLFALVAGMGLLGFHEYARMWRVKAIHVAYEWGAAACLLLFARAQLAPDSTLWLGAILSATAIGTLSWLLFNYASRTITDAVVTIVGVVYVGFLLSHLILLRSLVSGLGWVALAFLCTWAADTFAYFVGIAVGKRKLAPAISPGKSVEGVAGGSAGALLIGAFSAPLAGISPWQGALVGLAVSLVSVLGDLTESALKRHVGVKDSGSLLPGHGGVLDRFDSSLFVLPFVYYVARLFFVG